MVKKSEKGGDILMTGGGELNTGIHKAFEEDDGYRHCEIGAQADMDRF